MLGALRRCIAWRGGAAAAGTRDIFRRSLLLQTTLLGLGIALIAALVAALVGPVFVDWGRYRAVFEARASRMIDQPVRIGGAIDVRLLPTPLFVLRDIEAGPRASPVFGAQLVGVELSLGSLIRGEWRAATLELRAPEITVSLDRDGRLVSPPVGAALDLDRFSIDRVLVSDGQLYIDEADSPTGAALRNISFSGEVRSLAGPIKGEGTFVAGDDRYRYSFSVARFVDEGAPVRLTLQPEEYPLNVQADGLVSLGDGMPKFEGTLALTRPAGAILASGKAVASEPWRLSGKFKADAHRALFDQVEAQYGPDERGIRLAGAATMAFGAGARLEAVLSARQMDLDRALAPASTDRLPLITLRGLLDSAATTWRPPIAIALGFGIDTATLGGGTLQAVRGDLIYADDSWNIDNLEFRAPGVTQVGISGRIGGPSSRQRFSGAFELQSVDPGALATWLEGVDRTRAAPGELRLRGEMELSRDQVAVDRVEGELDRKPFQGRIAYTFTSGDTRAKLDASLAAAEFDLGGAIALVRAASSGSSFERPGEIALTVDLGKTRLEGVEAISTNADVRIDAAGVKIERLSIADLGGAAVSASGNIDLSAGRPNGAIAVAIDAQKVEGIAALVGQFFPGFGQALASRAGLVAPARLNATISVAAGGDAGAAVSPGVGRLAINGNVGAVSVAISGEAAGPVDALPNADLRFDARLTSPDATVLKLIGADRIAAESKQPSSLSFVVTGPASGDIRVSARLAGKNVEATADGTLRLSNGAPAAALDVTAKSDDAQGLRRGSGPLPIALKARATVSAGTVAFSDIAGSVAGSPVRGALSISAGAPMRLGGQLSADKIDLAALILTAAGAPPPATRGWSSQAFAPVLPEGLSGRVELVARQADIGAGIVARNVRGALEFAPSSATLANATGSIGRGDISADISLRRNSADLAVRGRVAITKADPQQFVSAVNAARVNGQLSAQLEFEAAGPSPATLIGSLSGGGSLTLEKAQIAGFDDKAIDVAARAAERGTTISVQRIGDIVGKVMEAGSLSVPWATVPFEISAGRLRFGRLLTSQDSAETALAGSIDLVEQTLDTRVTVYGGPRNASTQRPEVAISFSGPLANPQRKYDVSALVGWLTLRAVDRETERLEAEEREAKRREAAIRELERQEQERQRELEQQRELEWQLERQRMLERQAQQSPAGAPPGEAQSAVPIPPSSPATGTVSRGAMPPPPRGMLRQNPRSAIESAPLPLVPR
jgi:large subunit ribosomal protein L24